MYLGYNPLSKIEIVSGLNVFNYAPGSLAYNSADRTQKYTPKVYLGTTQTIAITRIGQDIIPIEVKSNDNTKSKSLNEYNKTFNPAYSIRISAKNFGYENNIKSIPLYAVFCINKENNML